MDVKKIFGRFESQGGFVKTTLPPPKISSGDKAALNRKGNMLFNSGDVETARRIFETTGYSDGLSRVGDWYKSHGRPLDALMMYWKAPDKTKSEPLIASLAAIVRGLIDSDKDTNDE